VYVPTDVAVVVKRLDHASVSFGRGLARGFQQVLDVFFEASLADCLTGKVVKDILHPKVCFAGPGLFASLTTLPFLVGVRVVADMLSRYVVATCGGRSSDGGIPLKLLFPLAPCGSGGFALWCINVVG
jgi:hypothetical protein